MQISSIMLREDDSLVLNGQWACEIVCLLDDRHPASTTAISAATSFCGGGGDGGRVRPNHGTGQFDNNGTQTDL